MALLDSYAVELLNGMEETCYSLCLYHYKKKLKCNILFTHDRPIWSLTTPPPSLPDKTLTGVESPGQS